MNSCDAIRWLVLYCLSALPARAAEPPITAAAFAPDGRAVVGSQSGVRIVSWPGLKPAGKLTTRLSHVHDLVFSPARDVLAIAGGSPADDGAIELVSWPSRELLRRLDGHADVVQSVAWSADGKQLVTASADGSSRIHDTANGKLLKTFDGHAGAVFAVAFLPGGTHVLSAGSDQSLRLWEAATGKPIRVMENHTGPVHALAMRPPAPDSLPLFASASGDRTVRLWQPTIGRMMKIKRLPAAVLSVAWSSDGKHLIAGCADGRVRVIDPDSLDVLADEKVLDGWVYTLAVPDKGREVLAAGEKGSLARAALPR